MARILMSGSNRGIGAAFFGAAREAGHEAIGTIRDGRDRKVSLTLDNPDTIATKLAEIGPLDMRVSNAGVITPERQSPLNMGFAGIANSLTVNAITPLALAQAVLSSLRESASHLTIKDTGTLFRFIGEERSS